MEKLLGQPLAREYRLSELLLRPEVSYQSLMALAEIGPGLVNKQAAEQVEIQAKYGGYIERQLTEIARLRKQEDTRLPVDLNYQQVKGLSAEVCEKLNKAKPATVGQASRIPGITPAAISLLLIHLKKHGYSQKNTE
jgi:tRNA uridine 5-carboxymethylaminomethyl modification enzyme